MCAALFARHYLAFPPVCLHSLSRRTECATIAPTHQAKCTGNMDASTPSEPYLPFGDLCRSGRHCQFLGEKLARCQKEWGLPQDIVLGTEDCTCGYNPEKELFAAGAGGLGGSSSLKGEELVPCLAPLCACLYLRSSSTNPITPPSDVLQDPHQGLPQPPAL
jgi:hypothetical protein